MTLAMRHSGCLIPVLLAAAITDHASAKSANLARRPAAADQMLCDTTVPGSEHHYVVSGRIRLLVFWTGRHDVGQARFDRAESPAGARRLALRVGTDPERAPRRINRWGYIDETTCAAETVVTGVMTESKEQSVEQARGAAERPKHTPLRAIRSRIAGTESITETTTIAPSRSVTYRDLDEVLLMKPSAAAVVRRTVPADVESGFLRAVTSLINESVGVYRDSQRPPGGLRRVYVYGGSFYDLALRRSRQVRGADGDELESDFAIRNRTTGTTTEFRISYAASGHNAGVPRRIVFSPRNWLELELRLEEPV
jgi:hypothetical protein